MTDRARLAELIGRWYIYTETAHTLSWENFQGVKQTILFNQREKVAFFADSPEKQELLQAMGNLIYGEEP